MGGVRQVILASGSARRKEILELLGVEFVAVESGFDEELVRTEDPVELVEELAWQKAWVVGRQYPEAIVVAGDTTVEVEEEILNKADSAEEARQMIRKLAGKRHRVYSGVAVWDVLTNEQRVGSEWGEVVFEHVREEELERYVAQEKNWRGFAGAYALQGGAQGWVREQTGVFSAIIGLPVALTAQFLEEMGVRTGGDSRRVEEILREQLLDRLARSELD